MDIRGNKRKKTRKEGDILNTYTQKENKEYILL